MEEDTECETSEEQLISRPYQTQLEDIAITRNTIIHLPTGSGKTFIAIRLINRFKRDLLEPWGQGGKRTFFLVNTIPLVNQQKAVIKKLSAVKSVAGYSGEDGIDYWDKTKWDAELARHQVIVLTSQILADMLTHSYIRIEDINLLIFDECHHAVVDHPMRLVMKHFEGCSPSKQPRVLGLTATLLNANVNINKVQETLRDLETTFHATIATVNELGEVLNYSTNPRESIIYYATQEHNAATQEAIAILDNLAFLIMKVKLPKPTGDPDVKLDKCQRDISTDPKKIVKEVKNMVCSMIALIQELGVFGGALSVLAYVILFERLKRKCISKQEEFLYSFAISHSVMARAILLNEMKGETGFQKILKYSSEKVLNLLNILKEYNPCYMERIGAKKINQYGKALSGIIFTKQRFTAKILYNLIKEVVASNNEEFGFLKHDYIVGYNINPYKCTREQFFLKKSTQTALLKFSNQDLNLIISTSVIEEGVDIPQCMLVVRYDPPLEYRSYIQSKGRARNSESEYIIMVNMNDRDKFLKQYVAFQHTEKYLQQVLVGNTEDRNAPNLSEIEGSLYHEDEIPPYITKTGARLSSVQAISLLNRYCSVLPHDQFTTITPIWIEEKVHGPKGSLLRQVKLYMPIACPVKEMIAGLPMQQLKSAKRSAALNACIKLHEAGELEASLLPRHFGLVDFDKEEVKLCFPNWPSQEEPNIENVPKTGTKKRIRKYIKVAPTYLRGLQNWTEGSQKMYLHVIKLNLAFKEPFDSREKALFHLLNMVEGYGFLTFQPLPKLCDFPLFLTVGEVMTSTQMNYAVIELDLKLFELVKQFHFFIFDQVLGIAQKFTVFDAENCLFIVPVIGKTEFDIDWRTMQQHKEIRPVSDLPTVEERLNLNVTTENYLHHVVTPYYRDVITPARYIVSNVLEYMTPNSHLDSTSIESTFADYYSDKYSLEIIGNESQPLLEVRNISSRMNCLVPRAASIKKAFTDKQVKLISQMQGDDRQKNFLEILIAEFCIKYDFPGVYWYKAILLPSYVHRLYMLLVAYDIRVEIAKNTNIGKPHLSDGEEWKPVAVHYEKTVQTLMSLIEERPPVRSIDRINNPINEDAPRPHRVVSMRKSLYELQKKKLSQDFDWDESIEPTDIERNIATVTVMDIECYDQFVSTVISRHQDTQRQTPSPPLPTTSGAILPSPVEEVCTIAILSKKPTQRGPELCDVLAALTTVSSNDTFDLERVETLGDSFLKFAATLYLYHKFPLLNEGQLTNIKSRLIGNRNLYYAGSKVMLGSRMKVDQFGPRKDFVVPGFLAPKEIRDIIMTKQIRPTCLIGMEFSQEEILSGQLSPETMAAVKEKFDSDEGTIENEPEWGVQSAMQCYINAQTVSDKSIADCVEGLLGTYLISEGILGAVKVLEWLKVLPPQDDFTSYLHKADQTLLKEGKATEDDINRVMYYNRDDVEQIIGYKFKDPSYLLEALSHPSYIRNRLTRSYERLEFLGDAILDFLITSHIFESCPNLKPGELTDLRSALVNNVTFASYVVKLGLHKYICYQLNPMLEHAIMTFIDHQERRDHQIVEDVLYLIDEEDCQISEYVEVPKVLSDIFESLAGAIYLDSGGSLNAVWTVFYRVMCKEIHAFSCRVPKQPVRMLYEMMHACPEFGKPQFVDSEHRRVMVPVTITKNGQLHTVHGFGGNKFQAKRAAAKLALKVLCL